MKRAIGFSIAAAVAAALVVGQVFGQSSTTKVSLSIFKRPQTAADRLPRKIVATHMATHFANGDSRLVGHLAGASWYAVPGEDNTVCLMGTKGELSWGGCTLAAILKDSVIWNARQNDQTHQ